MSGVMCGIDAVGYQARSFANPDKENPIQVIEELVHVVNPTGRIGVVGVYFAEDPGGVHRPAKRVSSSCHEKFDRRSDGYTKVILKPAAPMLARDDRHPGPL